MVQRCSPRVTSGVLKDTLANAGSHLRDSLAELLRHGLTLERFDSVRVGRSGHDDERHDSRLGAHLLEAVVETRTSALAFYRVPCILTTSHYSTRHSIPVQDQLTSKRLEEHVDTLISKLITTRRKHVNGILEVKVVVAIKVTAYKVVDLVFGLDVQVLELVHRGKLDDVETVGKDTVCLISSEIELWCVLR